MLLPRVHQDQTRSRRARQVEKLLLSVCFWWGVVVQVSAHLKAADLAPLPPGDSFTFAVFGDNRGGSDGELSGAFREIMEALVQSPARLVLNTGDMIYGNTFDPAQIQKLWQGYRAALSPLKVPVYHVPGNHDIWDKPSAVAYRELWGPTYYAFDYGPARFIALDTETEPSRLSMTQFAWLQRQLESADGRLVFAFLHRPLFPVDGAIGSSLDVNAAERDRLHQLFVQHRSRIKAVFQGHEHLYHFAMRDGIPYYITGGGGANLYVAPELGGFHHFLLVHVKGQDVDIELRKVGAPNASLGAAVPLSAAPLLESWESGRFCFAWNYTATVELTREQASEGRQGLRLSYDLAQWAWPVLAVPLPTPLDLTGAEALLIDIYLPPGQTSAFTLTPGLEASAKHETQPVVLKAGWNTVRAELGDGWLPPTERAAVRSLQWTLTTDRPEGRGAVVFDQLRLERRVGDGRIFDLLESWERPLLWRVADENVAAETTPQYHSAGRAGVKVQFDLSQSPEPVLLARLNPPWDLTRTKQLLADLYAPTNAADAVSIRLGLRAGEASARSRPVRLKEGWNTIRFDLDNDWLPPKTRAAAEQIEWVLSSGQPELKSWVVFDNLRSTTVATPEKP